MNQRVITRFRFWAAICLVGGFILPWVSLGFFSANGYQIAQSMRDDANRSMGTTDRAIAESGFRYVNAQAAANADERLNSARLEAAMSYMIDLIPIVALCCIILELRGSRPRIVYAVSGLLVLGILALFCQQQGADFLQHLAIGGWVTIAAGIGTLIGAFAPEKSNATAAPAVLATAGTQSSSASAQAEKTDVELKS